MIWLWLQDSVSCRVRKKTREFTVLRWKYKVRLGELCKNLMVLARPKLALLGLHHGNLQALASGGFRHGSLPSCSTVSDLVACS